MLLCNHALGWPPQPRQPPGNKAHALAWRPDTTGGPGRGPAGGEVGAEATANNGSRGRERGGTRHEGRAVKEESQARRRSLVPGVWELGSKGWVFRVFCNYFPFVLP